MRRYVIGIDTITHTYSKLYIAGRVYEGVIQIGDRFSLLERQGLPGDEGNSFRVAIDLKVERINLYRCDMNQVSAGMTAGLELSGDLNLRLGPRDQLVGESRNGAVISTLISRDVDMPLLSV